MKELSGKALMDSAWRELRGVTTSVTGTERSSRRRSSAFAARYSGICDRCGLPIRVGQDARVQRDFAGVVHTQCCAPEVSVGRVDDRTARFARQLSLCPACHLEHAGEYW